MKRKNIPFTSGTSFNQFLKTQLHSFSLKGKDLQIAEFLIGSLDNLGYLRRELLDISDDLAFTQGIDDSEDEKEKILEKIYLLDPPGVGAKDLKHCLLLQLKENQTKNIEIATEILENHFDLFSKNILKKSWQSFV